LWAVAAIVVVVVGWAVFREREPVYQGKTLSEWMAVRQWGDTPAKKEEADDALQRIGTNALPILLKWLRYEQPQWRNRAYVRLISRLPRWVGGIALFNRLLHNREWEQAGLAADTVHRLGAGATNAIPELVAIMARTSATNASQRAVYVLASLGTAGLPPMLNALSDPGNAQRQFIARMIPTIRELGSNGHPAVPILLNCLQERDAVMVMTAAESLGSLRLEAEIVVPALVRGLTNENYAVRAYLAKAVSEFGKEARGAVPALLEALDDRDDWARKAAAAALEKIGSEELEKDRQTRTHKPPTVFHPFE